MFLQYRQCRDEPNTKNSNFLPKNGDADLAIYLSDRSTATSTYHLFNGTIIDCIYKKQ